MYTLLSLVALSCYSIFMAANGASAERRQSNSPVDCSALVLEVNVTTTTCPQLGAFQSAVDAITTPGFPQWNTGQNRDWLEDTLNDFCTTDCLEYTLEYYSQNCSGWPEGFANSLINLYQDYYCGSRSGQYCLVEIMDYLADTTIILDWALQCSTDEIYLCSPPCMEVLEGFQNELGCCAVNLFNNTQTSFPFENDFQRCGLSLNPSDMCSGAQQKNIGSLLLLFVAVSLSTFCLS